MIQKLEKISMQIFQNAMKTYHIKDVITHKRVQAKNINEMLSLYPNKGVGFTIRKKTWPKNMYYSIKETKFKSLRFGNLYGVLSKDNQVVDQHPKTIAGCSKRGIWEYDFGNFKEFTTDNGIIYTKIDYQAFQKLRGLGITQPKPLSTTNESTPNTESEPQQTAPQEKSN